jgi:MFS family permease
VSARLARVVARSLVVLTTGLLAIPIGAAVFVAPPVDSYVRTTVAAILAMAAYAPVGGLIASRRPGNPIGWIFLAVGLAWALAYSANAYMTYATVRTANLPAMDGAVWVSHLWIVAALLIPLAVILFPEGRLPSRRWRPAVWLVALGIALGFVSTTGRPDIVQNLTGGAMLLAYVLAAVAIALRLRRARGVERAQLKWITYAAGILMLTFVVLALIWGANGTRDPVSQRAVYLIDVFLGIPMFLAFTCIPVAIGIAILRYRLYDIDRLINRTLVYGALTAALAVSYHLAVAILHTALSPFGPGSELAVAGSTLAVAALFFPLRRRIQRAVDRRFYRSRYDASRTLNAFAARLRDEVDLGAVASDLLAVVHETLQPARASVWLRGRTQ